MDVDSWDEPCEDLIPDNALMAPYCRGRCARCAKQLTTDQQSAESQALGIPVAVFSAENRQDPLVGFPGHREGLPTLDLTPQSALTRLFERHHAELCRQPEYVERIEPLLTVDEVALRKTINYYFRHASVVEAMVVALQHMQISVCTLRGFSGKGGVSSYRKNIICFRKSMRVR